MAAFLFIVFLFADFALGIFLGAFGSAAIIYPLTVTRRVLIEAKRQKVIDKVPLAPIILPPLLWLVLLPAITLANLYFLPQVADAYFIGFSISLIQVLLSINNPTNEQEAIEQNRRYFKEGYR